MPWGAVAAAVVGAYASDQAAGKAAKASKRATDASIAEQRREYDQTRADQMPWLLAGQSALSQMQTLNSGDYSSFKQSPDYQFALDEGLNGLDRSAAARGALYSGGHSADVVRFGEGLASQNYGNYYNRLASLAGLGQTSASNLGSLGQGTANSIGNLLIGNANNQINSIYDQSNAWNNALNQGASAFGQWRGSKDKSMNGGWYLGNHPGPG